MRPVITSPPETRMRCLLGKLHETVDVVLHPTRCALVHHRHSEKW